MPDDLKLHWHEYEFGDEAWERIRKCTYDIFEATLKYPVSQTVKVKRLVDDFNFISLAGDNPWEVFVDMTGSIPPGHPWQEAMISCVHYLRKCDDLVPIHPEMSENWLPSKWSDLGDYHMYVTEADNNFGPGWLGDGQPRNFNSFLARERTDETAHSYRGICELRGVLESSQPGDYIPPLEDWWPNGVWSATEWLIYSGDMILKHLMWLKGPGKEDDARDTWSYRCGPLAQGVPYYGIERWEFWKRRLAEAIAETAEEKLSNELVDRVSQALKVMAEVEEKAALAKSHEQGSSEGDGKA